MMDPQVVVAIVFGVFTLFGTMFWIGYRQGTMGSELCTLKDDMKNLRGELDSLEKALFRRGQAELAIKNFGTFNSPFNIGKLGIDAVLPFIEEFVPFYLEVKRNNPDMPDHKFILLLEEKFGDKIIEKICTPNGLDSLGCLVAILDVCKLQEGRENTTSGS